MSSKSLNFPSTKCIIYLYINFRQRIATKCSWSIEMQVNVIGSEGCRSVGDALRDLDAKGLIRGHFVLLGADSITNAQLFTILEEHK